MFAMIGNGLIFLSVCLIFIGLAGVFRFRDFYSKLIIGAKIDTVALVTLILGVAFRSGINWFTMKLLLIMAFVLLVGPVVTSKIALSAREDELQQQVDDNEEEEE